MRLLDQIIYLRTVPEWDAVSSPTPPPPPAAAVFSLGSPVSANEGNDGTTSFVFTVTRSVVTTGAATIDWAVTGTGSNPANAADFNGGVLPSGTLNFADGDVSKTITVLVAGDVTVELDETFRVTLSNPSTGSIGTSTSDGTVLNDDVVTPPPPPPPTGTMTAPPSISGENVEGGILWGDVGAGGLTAPTQQWLWGATETPRTAFSPNQTGDFVTLGQIGGQYVCFAVDPGNGEAIRYSDPVRIHHDTMTPPVLARTSASGASPVTYTVNYPDNTVTADDIERIQVSLNSDFSSLLWDATRGLTEAAFNPPYTPDDSIDADPSWSTDPPTFNDAIARFWRRKAISSVTLNGTPIESGWSNTESNFTVSSAVTIAAGSSHPSFTISNGDLTFTHTNSFSIRVGTVTAPRTGKRTADLVLVSLPSLSYLGIGMDDGTFNWTGSVGPETNGWKGFMFYAAGDAVNSFTANGSTFAYGPSANAGQGFTGWAENDILRMTYEEGATTAVCTRIRAGVETAALTLTGLSPLTNPKLVFMSRVDGTEGDLILTGLTPAVGGGSSEYQ